jgi:hypothetical protein
MVRPSRRAFLSRGHASVGQVAIACSSPLAHGGQVSGAPLATAHEAPDSRRTIGEAKVARNDCGDACEDPECIAEAMGAGALSQEVSELFSRIPQPAVSRATATRR